MQMVEMAAAYKEKLAKGAENFIEDTYKSFNDNFFNSLFKNTLIPFNYKETHKDEAFGFAILNEGIALCRRLGYEPIAFHLGKKEWTDIHNWTGGDLPKIIIKDNKMNYNSLNGLNFYQTNQESTFLIECKN